MQAQVHLASTDEHLLVLGEKKDTGTIAVSHGDGYDRTACLEFPCLWMTHNSKKEPTTVQCLTRKTRIQVPRNLNDFDLCFLINRGELEMNRSKGCDVALLCS